MGGSERGVRVLYRFQICSTYVYPFAYAFLPLFALHFNALSSLNRCRYAIHTHTHSHAHTHTLMEPQSNSNSNCCSIFSNTLVSISRFLLNLPPHLPPARAHYPLPLPSPLLSGSTTDRANWFHVRGSLHYAGTYVFKFHSCVAFFLFFLLLLLFSISCHHSYMHACWRKRRRRRRRGTRVARLPRAERRR